jgi:hypothetical protein
LRARQALAGALGLLFLILIFPFQVTVVPAWSFRVVDDQGKSVVGINVTEHWQHNLLESTGDEDLQRTGSEGVIAFPRRTMRASFITRLTARVGKFFKKGAEARTNPYASVVVWGSKDHETNVALYKEGEPPVSLVNVTRVRK